MKYIFSAPITIGDLQHRIAVDELELASVSINFEPTYSDKGTAMLSITLTHRASGHKYNVVWPDAGALAFWRRLDAGDRISAEVFAKLIAEGKLPPGTLVP